MSSQNDSDFEFKYKGNGIYTLLSKGTLILEGTFEECVTEYEKRFEGVNN